MLYIDTTCYMSGNQTIKYMPGCADADQLNWGVSALHGYDQYLL